MNRDQKAAVVEELAGQIRSSDAVFAVKDSLIVPFVSHESGTAPDGTKMDRPYFTVQYDFGLKATM